MPVKWSPRIVAASVGTMLAGCTSYSPRDLAPPATFARHEARRLDDPALLKLLAAHGPSAEAAAGWDQARLTLAAFHFSPDLAVARARLAEAEAGVRVAEIRPNPSFKVSLGKDLDVGPTVSPWILGYALDVPWELFGRRDLRTAEARHRAEAAGIELARAAWTVRRAVTHALVLTQAAAAEAELWNEQRMLCAEAARLVAAQAEAGETSAFAVAQARTELDRATLAARDSERAAVAARSRLAEAIGVPVTALDGVRLPPLESPEAAVLEGARPWAAQNHPDLLAALADYVTAQSALQAEVARQYPDLTLGPGYVMDKGERKWALNFGFTLPLFHRNEGPMAVAQARRETAAAHFLAVQHRVLAAVDRAEADYRVALGDVATAREMRQGLTAQARQARARLEAGDISGLDLTRARIALADQARVELAARVRAVQALLAFEDAVCRPLAWPESAWRQGAVATAP